MSQSTTSGQTESLVETDARKIGKQIVLPLRKAVEIAVKSLRIRFWRSMITMSGIILAIAFVMAIWCGNAFIAKFKDLDLENKDRADIMIILQRDGVDVDEGASLSAKQIWLIVLSLLVCVVGISNAMLMSVAERIREIGTMKCLGALDGFIIKLFLLESSMQGLSGTGLGIGVGFVLMFFSALLKYGWYSLRYFPLPGIFVSALLCVAVGSLLSVLAAIGPAYSAAKMQPVDAMRVEE